METLDEIKKKLPPQTRVIFEAFWEKLPSTEKKSFLDLVRAFPSETNLFQLLLKLGSEQFKVNLWVQDSYCDCWTGKCG